jgi:hypothetical protein
MTEVRIVEQKGLSALVEWHEKGRTHRAFVPADKIEGGQCPKSELDLGAAYGEVWEDFISDLPTAKQVAEALRNNNIWTMDDLLKRTLEAKQIFRSLYGQVFGQFMEAIRGGKAK